MANETKFRKYALVICLLPFLGYIISAFTQDFRYSNYRYIYQMGDVVKYCLWGASFVWGLGNSLDIYQTKDSWRRKALWITLSSLPSLFFILILVICATLL
jgi:hypothetical protein